MSPGTRVALTGANGYVGSYICAELLRRGYVVHAPVRSLTPTKVAHLTALTGANERLKLFPGGDLTKAGSFDEAFEGCDAVIHTAAKVELGTDPAVVADSVEGVECVMASIDAAKSVRRMVQTSSIAAIQRYDKPNDYVFSEDDWNDYSRPETDAYGYAKTLAERRAAKRCLERGLAYVALNPAVVIGPVMTKQHTKASPIFLRNIIFGNPIFNVPSSFVDVRDVATAHVEALERIDDIVGPRRFVLASDYGCINATELVAIAEGVLPQYDFSAPPMYDPVRMRFLYMPLSRLPLVGRAIMSEYQRRAFATPIHFDNAHAKAQLGLTFKPLPTTVCDGVESIVAAGYATPRPRRSQ